MKKYLFLKSSVFVVLSIMTAIPRICLSQEVNTPHREANTQYSYEYKNDTLRQTLTISFLSEETISFSYMTVNKNNNSRFCVQGNANLRNGDAEMDENEDGVSYLVDLFEYQKECYLAIRIDAETYSRIRIVAGDCDSYNILSSVDYLTLVQ